MELKLKLLHHLWLDQSHFSSLLVAAGVSLIPAVSPCHLALSVGQHWPQRAARPHLVVRCSVNKTSSLSFTTWSRCSCPEGGGGRCPSRSPTPSRSWPGARGRPSLGPEERPETTGRRSSGGGWCWGRASASYHTQPTAKNTEGPGGVRGVGGVEVQHRDTS